MASLLFMAGPGKGQMHLLDKQDVTIGREEDCQIRIPDEMISRHHCRIHFDPAGSVYHLSDLASSNGVYVNGIRIGDDFLLHDNDVIELGATRIAFHNRDIAEESCAFDYAQSVSDPRHPAPPETPGSALADTVRS